MSAIDELTKEGQGTPKALDVVLTIRKLASNKDLRIFLTAICRYSKGDWKAFVHNLRCIYDVLQSSILIKQDSQLADEIMKVPHFKAIFARLDSEDVG